MRKLLLILVLLCMPVLCAQETYIPEGGGGTTASPSYTAGITDGVGGEATLDYLYNMTRIARPEVVGDFTTIYVSSQPGGDLPMGADTNSGGTPEDPIRTLDRIDEIITERGCKVEFVLDGYDLWIGATDFGSGLNSLATECADNADGIDIYIRSSSQESRATLDCTGGTPASAVVGTGAGSATAGWVVVEGLHVQNCPTDGFSTGGTTDLMVINSGTHGITGGNNSFTSHNSSHIVGINVYAHHDVSGASASVLTGAEVLIITDDSIEVEDVLNTSTGPSNLSAGSTGELVVVGARLSVVGAVNGSVDGVQISPLATTTEHATLIRTSINGADMCFNIDGANATSTANLTLFQTTCSNAVDDAFDFGITDATSLGTVTAQCLLLDEIGGEVIDDVNPCEDMNVNITSSVHDEDDIVNSFIVDNTAEPDVADSRTTLDAAGCTVGSATWVSLFEDAASVAAESGTSGTDGVQWDDDNNNTVDANYIPGQGCHPDMECWEACDVTFTKTLPTAIPEWVAGAEITTITIGGTDQNIGAR